MLVHECRRIIFVGVRLKILLVPPSVLAQVSERESRWWWHRKGTGRASVFLAAAVLCDGFLYL